MKEYIDRNAAEQAKPEFLNEKVEDYEKAIYAKGWNDCNTQYRENILSIPSANVVEVVRCRDCKYKEQNVGRYHVKLPFYCTLHDEKFCDEMEFCSYGAKMDGGAE